MTYKDQVKLIDFIVKKYNKQKQDELQRLYCFDIDLVNLIDHSLNRLDQESLRIIHNDFILPKPKQWWNGYYSKTIYYRLKNKAMSQFINCLHNRIMI